jgi:hypothetical protein
MNVIINEPRWSTAMRFHENANSAFARHDVTERIGNPIGACHRVDRERIHAITRLHIAFLLSDQRRKFLLPGQAASLSSSGQTTAANNSSRSSLVCAFPR